MRLPKGGEASTRSWIPRLRLRINFATSAPGLDPLRGFQDKNGKPIPPGLNSAIAVRWRATTSTEPYLENKQRPEPGFQVKQFGCDS
ncbi:MAG: hypothetical protein Ct9H300mP1_32570 [Planctomycetaceae bacterium]|nr:MAG: hypothetical protein Ct9H300mP1_32570 [Planctomycetaceae bacterium]